MHKWYLAKKIDRNEVSHKQMRSNKHPDQFPHIPQCQLGLDPVDLSLTGFFMYNCRIGVPPTQR